MHITLQLPLFTQMHSSKCEEYTERREERRTADEHNQPREPPQPPPDHSTDHQRRSHKQEPHSKPHDQKSPKHKRQEKFSRETRPGQEDHSPFCEDTYYSMRDESDDATNTSRTQKKTYVVSESHTKIMSDKKSEVFHTSNVTPMSKPGDSTPHAKTFPVATPQSPKNNISSTRDENDSIIKTPTVIDAQSIEVLSIDRNTTSLPDPPKQRPYIESLAKIDNGLKSANLIKNARVNFSQEKELEPFPFVVEDPVKVSKPKGQPPPKPKIFVMGEIKGSENESDLDTIKFQPKWVPTTDSESEEPSYARVKPIFPPQEKRTRIRTPTPPTEFDILPAFNDPPRPKVEFPESDSEYDRPPSPITIKEAPTTIAPTKLRSSKIKPIVIAPPIKELSPVLQPEPIAEEGYIPPPPLPIQYESNTLGVESTQITTISDTSQFHKRYITQQHTTRMFKISDVKYTPQPKQNVDPVIVPKTETLFNSIPPIPAAPPPEELPFTLSPRRPRKPKTVPPPRPKTFHKGDFRESDYDSEDDSRIRPKWQPTDSDADDPSYNKVRAPSTPARSSSRNRDKSPTPPSAFEIPPECGAPLRPTVEKVIVQERPEKNEPVQETLPKHIKRPQIQKESARSDIIREPSPVLPPPGPVPEEGIIVQTTEYVVDKVKVESHPAPPQMKEVPTFQQKPYTEIVEKTEKIYRKKHIKEEINYQKNRQEKITTTIHHYEDEDPTVEVNTSNVTHQYDDINIHIPANGVESVEVTIQEAVLEEFPFKPSPPRPKRERGKLPSKPKVFVKGDFNESDYDSDYDSRIRPRWNPTESETDDDPTYHAVSAPKLKRRTEKEKQRTPTPPSRFEEPPPQGGPLRPDIKMIEKLVISPISFEASEIDAVHRTSSVDKVKPFNISTSATEEISLPPPGPQPEFGYISSMQNNRKKEDYVIEEKFQVPLHRSDDEYYPVTESDFDYTDSDIPKFQQALNEPSASASKRPSGSVQSIAKKFFKRDDNDTSPVQPSIASRWCLPDSEGDDAIYNSVPRPHPVHRSTQQPSCGSDPLPPSKFDLPPQFEGPPRPTMEKYSLHHRERRESLEDYSVPKFPKVEFKPFTNENGTHHPSTNGVPSDKDLQSVQHQTPEQSKFF